MLTNLSKAKYEIDGVKGLPDDYPVPKQDERTLFYIQRNLNKNTVIYETNVLYDGRINEEFPMHPYWIKFSHGSKKMELNHFQNKMAYGYKSKLISSKLFEFQMVSYNKLQLYLVADDLDGRFKTITTIGGQKAILNNIYVYAEEHGLFPEVVYFELYGFELNSGLPTYEKIMV